MLTELFAGAAPNYPIHRDFISEFFPQKDLGLPDDAVAQWTAGLLYGLSGRTEDKRDKLVKCMKHCPFTARRFGKAYQSYNDGKLAKGNQKLWRTTPFWFGTMIRCGSTALDLAAFEWTAAKFNWRSDSEDVARANYEANKARVDQDWANGLKSFNEGVYFNAGMFYGEVWNVLAVLPKVPEEASPAWF